MSKATQLLESVPDTWERAYKLRVYLSPSQTVKLKRYIGSTRFTKNWALENSQPRYPGKKALSEALTLLRKTKGTKWLDQVPRAVLEQALRDRDTSFQRFFKKEAKYPCWNCRKGNGAGSIRFQLDQRHPDYLERQSWRSIQGQSELKRAWTELANERLLPEARQFRHNLKTCSIETISRWAYLRLPGLGRVKLRRTEDLQGKIATVTLTLMGSGRVYASLTATRIPLKKQKPVAEPSELLLANDVGFRSWDTVYNGKAVKTVPVPTTPPKLLKKEKRLCTRLNRGINAGKATIGLTPNQRCSAEKPLPPSRRRDKTRTQLAKVTERIASSRQSAVNELSSYLIKTARFLVLENLDVQGLCQSMNRAFRRKAHRINLGELRRQLTYKAAWRGRFLVFVDRFYPSSKECCQCHQVNKELKLEKYWRCPHCGQYHDRDENAVVNLYREGLRVLLAELSDTATGVRSESKARGEVKIPRRGLDSYQAQLLASLKRELVYPPLQRASFKTRQQSEPRWSLRQGRGLRRVG